MADKFPAPRYNSVPEPGTDPQIKTVPLANTEWGGRPVSTRGDYKNGQTIKHVGKDG